jgi:hypothetical protein
MRVGRSNAENPATDGQATEAQGDQSHPWPAGKAQSKTRSRLSARVS